MDQNETLEALREVRSFEKGELDEIVITESKDPAVVALNLIMKHKELERMAQGALNAMVADFASTAREVEGHKRFGGQHIAAIDLLKSRLLDSTRRFERVATNIRQQVEDTVNDYNRTHKA